MLIEDNYPEDYYPVDYDYVDEQEEPEFPESYSLTYLIGADGEEYPIHGCFGFVEGNLMLGTRHHQEIMALLIDKGWTWADLLMAEQIWGWYSTIGKDTIKLTYVSDAAFLHKSASKKCKQAFKDFFNKEVKGSYKNNGGDVKKRHGSDYGGDYERHYAKGTEGLKKTLKQPSVSSVIPEPPKKDDSEQG